MLARINHFKNPKVLRNQELEIRQLERHKILIFSHKVMIMIKLKISINKMIINKRLMDLSLKESYDFHIISLSLNDFCKYIYF